MDDPHKSGLYRWQRQTKPVVQSRSHRVTTSDNIQDWIKKVEDASTRATDVAFGLTPSSNGRKTGKALAQTRTTQARVEEEAYSEAQELLKQWVTEKVHLDEDDGLDDLEAWRRARNQPTNDIGGNVYKGKGKEVEDVECAADILNNIRFEDDEDDWEVDEAAIYRRVKQAALGDQDPYADLYDMDETEAVSSVLKTLMSKDVVKEAFKKDLGVGESAKYVPDPRTKMELRHQQVKENREKRQKEEMKKMKARQMKKEARLQAQQLIMKEQKDKDALVRKEEEEVKLEMARLRKELTTENRKKEDILRREREEKEVLENLARAELEREKVEEERKQLLFHRMKSERRKNQMIKQEMWRTKQEAKNLKCLHLHLTAWYDLVLARRLLLGKVKAMSDWKVMVKVWGAWKSFVRGQRAQVASVQHEKAVIESHRKLLTAETHHRHRVLSKCVHSWKCFVQDEIERREMEEEKERTKNKMMSLLTAVAEGKFSKENSQTSCGNASDTDRSKLSGRSNSSRLSSRNQNNNAMHRVQAWVDEDADCESQCSFTNVTKSSIVYGNDKCANNHRPPSALSSSRPSSRPLSVQSNNNNNNNNKERKTVPTQAWQVNKRHPQQLDVEEIRNLGQLDVDGDDEREEGTPQHFTDVQIRKRFGTQPWMNRHYVVNNFEHRYNAQQKALRQQQEEIREQKRLIQDLQYKQEQQASQKRLVAGVPSPSLPTEIDVPPKGKEIPRDDDNQASSQRKNNRIGDGTHDNGGAVGVGRRVSHANIPFDDDGNHHKAPITDRTELSSQRSEISKVTSTTSQNSKYIQVLKNMEDRAAQRARQKAEREEKRRKQEEEKLAELEKQEAERLKQEEEEKKARVEAYRQKKRLEKQKEEDRQREAARQQELLDKAKAHYERSILKYRGLLPLKKLISLSKRNWNKAVRQFNQSLMRQGLQEWKKFTQSEIQRKNEMADHMGQFLLVKHCFERWRKHKHHTAFLLRRAERHFESTLRCKVFQTWVEWTIQEKQEMESKMEAAEQYYWDHLLRSRFMAWKHLPEKQRREEERKKRKNEMRMRVAELIPDFSLQQSLGESVEASLDCG